MPQDITRVDATTSEGLMNACTSVVALEEGSCIHEEIIQIGYEWSVLVDSSFIVMYAKCGSLEDMQKNVQQVMMNT